MRMFHINKNVKHTLLAFRVFIMILTIISLSMLSALVTFRTSVFLLKLM